jgi:type III pantothenate kinase
MTTWLFDLGNTRLKCAPLQDGLPGGVIEATHDGENFIDGWATRLPGKIGTAFVSSVASAALTATLLDTLTQHCTRISLVRTQRECDGVRIAYDIPAHLGVDRFLALLAAHARARDPWLVVGVGTALTIDLLAGDGRHHGGRIAPSPTLMRQSLNLRAPHLPSSGGVYADFANDTAAGLASGCEGAAIALIAASRNAAVGLVGCAPRLVLHGGGGAALLPYLDDAVHAPALVLEGLVRWARTVGDTDINLRKPHD